MEKDPNLSRLAAEIAGMLQRRSRATIANTIQHVRPGIVETIDENTGIAEVRIEADLVTTALAWRTTIPPTPGDHVDVVTDPDGRMRMVAQIPGPPAPDLGAILPQVQGRNAGFISELWLWGHSYLGSPGTPGGYAFPDGDLTIDSRLFGALEISWPRARNYGRFGACIVDDWLHVMQTATYPFNSGVGPYLNPRGNHAFVYGANDIAFHGNPNIEGGRQKQCWKNAWHAVINWLRAGAVFQDDQIFSGSNLAGITYQPGRWTVGNSPNIFNYPFTGSGYHQTLISNSTFTVTVPADYPGTAVTLYFIGEIGSGVGAPSASVVSSLGTTAFSTDNTKRNPTIGSALGLTANGVVPIRVALPRSITPQTITVNSGTLAAGQKLRFDSWSIEAQNPPMICIANVPAIADWAGHGSSINVNPGGDPNGILWPGYPNGNGIQGGAINPSARAMEQEGDRWIAVYNLALQNLAIEYPPVGSVVIADIASKIDGRVYYYYYENPARTATTPPVGWDPVHPNNAGREIIAYTLLQAMDGSPVPAPNLISPYSANEDFFVASMLGGPM